MSRLRIIHTTTYYYSQPVEFGLHRLVLRPREGHDVQIEALTLTVTPECRVTWHRDLFGNSVALVCFLEASDTLQIRNEVVVSRRDVDSHRGLLDAMPVKLPLEYPAIERAAAQGYIDPVYPEETNALHQWVQRTFSPREGQDAVQLTHEIGQWIHDNIAYRRREDRGVQTPSATLNLRSGSCRDMATLLLEALRTLKLATRFASGYLDSPASAAGRAATHAWTEICFPNHGWFGYDPTLGESTSLKHIVMGVSSHPRGVMPVSGSYRGSLDLGKGMAVSVKIDRLAAA